MKKINRFGEVYYDKNEALVTMPFSRLDIEEVELLEENYRMKVKKIEHPDTFIYAHQFSTIRDRIQISFDLNKCVDFHNIHKIKLKDMLPYLYSVVEIAKVDANVLWQRNNMVIDLTEKRVKALLFEFDGFKIYKKDNAVDGLKEIILLALTNNTSIIAKPKRADFIEQTNEVFQFSDDIVSSKTVEEIENIIKGYERELEYQEIKSEKEKEEKKESSFFYNVKDKFKGKEKKKKPTEELKEKLNNEVENKSENKKTQGNLIKKITTPVGMISTLLVVLLVGFVFSQGLSSDASIEKDETQSKLNQKDKVLDAYRLYITNDEEKQKEAFAKLDAIGYDNLPEKDKGTLIDWYIEQEQYTKAITLYPESAYDISDKIIVENEDDLAQAKTQLETLQSSFQNNKVLNFDIARLENNYQGMIENSKLEKYNEKRSQKTVQAYVLTNQVEELNGLIKQYSDEEDQASYETLQRQSDKDIGKYKRQNDAEERIEELNKEIEEKEKEKDAEKDDDKEEDIKDNIKSMKKEIDGKEKEIKNIQESIKSNE